MKHVLDAVDQQMALNALRLNEASSLSDFHPVERPTALTEVRQHALTVIAELDEQGDPYVVVTEPDDYGNPHVVYTSFDGAIAPTGPRLGSDVGSRLGPIDLRVLPGRVPQHVLDAVDQQMALNAFRSESLIPEYGLDVTTPEGRLAFERQTKPLPFHDIESPEAYVAAVRRVLARQKNTDWIPNEVRDNRPGAFLDGRLIAAVWRTPAVRPSEWEAGGRAEEWLNYWVKTQDRPRTVGSIYNDEVRGVARAWALGLEKPPKNLAALLPPGWKGGRDRARALLILGQKGLPYAPPQIKTAELRRLSKLPGATLRAARVPYLPTFGIDWPVFAKNIEQVEALPRATLEKARIPAKDWPWIWDREAMRDPLRALAAVSGVVPEARLREWSHQLVTKYRDEVPLAAAFLNKSGLLKSAMDLEVEDSVLLRLAKIIKTGAVLPPHAWKSKHQLIEALDAEEAGTDVASANLAAASLKALHKEQFAEYQTLARAADRYAQENPKSAIADNHGEYERGRRIAPVLGEVLTYLNERLASGETLVVHGRDGELLVDLLRRSGADMNKVRYVITSRPLQRDQPPEYREYLKRMIPPGATHVDTGFAGSVPAWVDKNVVPVKNVALVSASDPEKQIPVKRISADKLRELVLADLEHSNQRLELPQSWGQLRYSMGAPGYWARLYGVCDVLGLPREAP